MDSKKIIEQLVKIAEKQQKIINKLAQAVPSTMSGTTDVKDAVAPVVQQAAQAVGAKGTYTVVSADKGQGSLKVKVQYPLALLGSPETRAVNKKVQELLAPEYGTVEVVGVGV